MFRRIFTLISLPTLALLGSLLGASPAAAQNQGYSVWAHRNQNGGGSRGSSYPTPSYYEGWTRSRDSRVTEIRSFYPRSVGDSYKPVSSNAAGNGSAVNRAVLITVSLPANAKIWFDEARTTQTGSLRQFLSPPLTPGHEYVYEVKARWAVDGKEVTRSRRVNVNAGDVTSISFDSDTAE